MVTIYALVCDVNGRMYIGCTAAKLAKRLREHRCLLRSGKHAEKGLLADWQRYGAAAFTMVPLVMLPPDCSLEEKRTAELKKMAEARELGLLYNTNPTSFRPTDEAIRKGVALAAKVNAVRVHSPESRLKRRLAQLGKPKNHGWKISATKQAKKAMR